MTHREICKYYLHGACRNGASCRFSHAMDAPKSTVCTYYLAGNCTFGDKCRYDHVRPDHMRGKVRDTPPPPSAIKNLALILVPSSPIASKCLVSRGVVVSRLVSASPTVVLTQGKKYKISPTGEATTQQVTTATRKEIPLRSCGTAADCGRLPPPPPFSRTPAHFRPFALGIPSSRYSRTCPLDLPRAEAQAIRSTARRPPCPTDTDRCTQGRRLSSPWKAPWDE